MTKQEANTEKPVQIELWQDGVFIAKRTLTQGELAKWEKYADQHEHLVRHNHLATLDMFLFNLRNVPGCNF